MKRQAKSVSRPRRSARARSAKVTGDRGGLLIPRSARADNKRGRGDYSQKRDAVVRCIRALPSGSVASYGAIARAAGWPGAARQVVRILQSVPGLPWHRVVGSGGAIKLRGESGAEQRFRLQMEGVKFRGARVDMARNEFRFKSLRH